MPIQFETNFCFISTVCAPEKVSDAFDELSASYNEDFPTAETLDVHQALAPVGDQVVLSLLIKYRLAV